MRTVAGGVTPVTDTDVLPGKKEASLGHHDHDKEGSHQGRSATEAHSARTPRTG